MITENNSQGWIGVDLDGTLAHYNGWQGQDHIGEPVPLMMERVKEWVANGYIVKIFTARVSVNYAENANIVQEWCVAHGLPRLEVTCKKDYAMRELWDDRAVQVIPNTGKALQDYVKII